MSWKSLEILNFSAPSGTNFCWWNRVSLLLAFIISPHWERRENTNFCLWITFPRIPWRPRLHISLCHLISTGVKIHISSSTFDSKCHFFYLKYFCSWVKKLSTHKYFKYTELSFDCFTNMPKHFFHFLLEDNCLYTFHRAEWFKIYNAVIWSKDVIKPRHYSVEILRAVLLMLAAATVSFFPD